MRASNSGSLALRARERAETPRFRGSSGSALNACVLRGAARRGGARAAAARAGAARARAELERRTTASTETPSPTRTLTHPQAQPHPDPDARPRVQRREWREVRADNKHVLHVEVKHRRRSEPHTPQARSRSTTQPVYHMRLRTRTRGTTEARGARYVLLAASRALTLPDQT